MTKDQLTENLGTIAKSGTANFFEKMKDNKNSNDLIGQFGVGFYSVFLVADQVVVVSKSIDDDQYIWKSDASGTYTIIKDPRGNTLGRGTQIKLFLKADSLEFLKENRLEDIVKKYSQFIHFPIYLSKVKTKTREVPMTEEEIKEVEEKEAEDRRKKEEETGEPVEEPSEPPARVKKETYQDTELEQVNFSKPIWLRDTSDITESEYEAFYKTLTKQHDKPTAWNHFQAEGEINFKSIVYITGDKPNQYGGQEESNKSKIKIFVKRVLIGDEFEDIVPFWMNTFVRGVIDSDDIPLNVSRETVSQLKIIKIIGKKTTKKVIETLTKLADTASEEEKYEMENKDNKDTEEYKTYVKETYDNSAFKYASFYKNFGDHLKQGMIHDSSNRSKLMELLRFQTTKTDRKIGLAE